LALFVALFILTPVFLGLAFLLVRKAWRRGWRSLAVAVSCTALLLDGLFLRQTLYQSLSRPVTIEARQAPGRYVFVGHDSRDELVLSEDGRFERTAVYRGVSQSQSGQWRIDEPDPRYPTQYVTFFGFAPECLHSTDRGGSLKWIEPTKALCGPGENSTYLCDDDGRVAICFDEDVGFDFRKQDPSGRLR
jgi:hypothetical protein